MTGVVVVVVDGDFSSFVRSSLIHAFGGVKHYWR